MMEQREIYNVCTRPLPENHIRKYFGLAPGDSEASTYPVQGSSTSTYDDVHAYNG